MDLERVRIDNKYGYKNENGLITIPPQFDDAEKTFVNGFSVVRIGESYGLINESGIFTVKCKYDYVDRMRNCLFAVRVKKDQYDWAVGVIDGFDRIIIGFDYKVIKNTYKSNYIVCYKYAKRSHVDKNTFSEMTNPSWYNQDGKFVFEGNACACGDYLITGDNNNIIINNQGETILNSSFTELYCLFGNFFRAKNGKEKEPLYGVIDEHDNIIIDFLYDEISDGDNKEYVCGEYLHVKGDYIKCISKSNDISENSTNTGVSWFNTRGKKIYEGEGEIRGELLCLNKGTKWSAVNIEGQRVLNYEYDNIISVGDYYAVGLGGRIGIVNEQGKIIISPIYIEVECVNIENKKYKGEYGKYVYAYYCKEYSFDTENVRSTINCSIHYRRYWPDCLDADYKSCFFINHIFILKTEAYCELFTIEDGLLDNSRYDEIHAITNNCFVVKKNNLYGIYRSDIQNTIIPDEFERIIYEGGKVVLVQKNGLWGAIGIDASIDRGPSVNIPIVYDEIKVLESTQNIYGVLKTFDTFSGKKSGYTIVKRNGDRFLDIIDYYLYGCVLEDNDCVPYFETQFEYFSYSLVKTSLKGKYGFISLDGHVSIPFKYDEIESRVDGHFNVRIGNAWGIIDLKGREFVAVKYKNKIPVPIDNSIVVDVNSNYVGVLAESGVEKIPTIYNIIIPAGRYFWVGYGSTPSFHDTPNFFSGYEYQRAIWGCIDTNGTILVPVKYDCFKQLGEYILAGRDGSMLAEGQWGTETYYQKDYGGVYDLFSSKGSFMIGGFSKMEIVDNLFFFFFGGNWENDDYQGVYSSWFNPKNGLWLVTDTQLNAIKHLQDDQKYNFGGIFVTIKEKTENGKKISYWNVPLVFFSKRKPKVGMNSIIMNEKGYEYAIRISDGVTSDFYEEMVSIDNNLFFFKKDGFYGIANYEGIIIKPLYSLFTIPVDGILFGIIKEDDNCAVEILDTNNLLDRSIIVIEKHHYGNILAKVKNGALLIRKRDTGYGTFELAISDSGLFDDKLFKTYPLVKEKRVLYGNVEKYWLSTDISESGSGYSYEEIVQNDYDRDTWDAMTDGMYGDMPDGFDGDYGFLGE